MRHFSRLFFTVDAKVAEFTLKWSNATPALELPSEAWVEPRTQRKSKFRILEATWRGPGTSSLKNRFSMELCVLSDCEPVSIGVNVLDRRTSKLLTAFCFNATDHPTTLFSSCPSFNDLSFRSPLAHVLTFFCFEYALLYDILMFIPSPSQFLYPDIQ